MYDAYCPVLGQILMHLFCIIFVFFFVFSEGYGASLGMRNQNKVE